MRGGYAPPVTLATIMARGTAVSELCDDRAPSGNAQDSQLVTGFLYQEFITAGLWRWLKDAIRRAGYVVLGTIHADVRFRFVVVRSQVLIGNGPIVAHSISRTGFEIPLRHAEGDSRPSGRPSAKYPRPQPREVAAR